MNRKQELTYRLNCQQMAIEVKQEKNLLKRKAKRANLKKLLNEWYEKKYPQTKEL